MSGESVEGDQAARGAGGAGGGGVSAAGRGRRAGGRGGLGGWGVRGVLVVYWLVLAGATHGPNFSVDGLPGVGGLPFDKLAHGSAFAGLAGLLVWSRWWGRRSWRWNAGAAVVVGLVYGVLEELTQPWFGRTRSGWDLLADAVGLGVGAAVAWGLAVWWEGRGGGGGPADGGEGGRGGGEEKSGNRGPVRSERVESRTLGEGGGEAAGEGGDEGGGGFVGHAAVVGGLTLVSRVAGLVRDAVLAGVFGASLVLDAFLVGFIVPNLFRRLFGEGALTAAFIPRYTRLLREDRALAGRFASLCVVAVATLLAGLTVLGEVGLGWWLASLEAADAGAAVEGAGGAGGGKVGLAVGLTMVMLPYMPLVCGVAFLGAMLQVHRRFGVPAAAPVLLNVVMIAAALGAGWYGGGSAAGGRGVEGAGVEGAGVPGVGMVVWVAGSVVLAGLLQLGWLGWSVWRVAPLGWGFAGTGVHFRRMLWTMLPMVVGLGVFQINTLLDGLIAYGLAAPEGMGRGAEGLEVAGWSLSYPLEAGAVTTLTLAQRLYQFPLGVFGIAIATAIFPALAGAVGAGGAGGAVGAGGAGDAGEVARGGGGLMGGAGSFGRIFWRGVRLTLFIGVPASVGLVLVRVPLTRVFFEWKAFSAEDAARAAGVLLAYGSAVWAYSLTHVTTKAFYALEDAATPLKVSLGMVGLNLGLNLGLIWPLGVAGLAWSTAGSAVLQTGVLVWLLQRRMVGRSGGGGGGGEGGVLGGVPGGVWGSVGRTVLLSGVMGLAVWGVLWPFDLMALGKLGCLGLLVASVGVGMGVYLVGAWGAGSPEMDWVRRRRV